MNLSHWGAPQFILFLGWLFWTVLPWCQFTGRATPAQDKAFGTRYMALCADRAVIFLLLWWGGFWS